MADPGGGRAPLRGTRSRTQISLGPQHIPGVARVILEDAEQHWVRFPFLRDIHGATKDEAQPLALGHPLYSVSRLDLLWFTLQNSALLFRCCCTSLSVAEVLSPTAGFPLESMSVHGSNDTPIPGGNTV